MCRLAFSATFAIDSMNPLKSHSRTGSLVRCLVAAASGLTLSACAGLSPKGDAVVSQSKGLAMEQSEYALFLQTKTPQDLLELKADPGKRLDLAMNLHATSELTEQAIAEGLDKDPVVAATLVEARRRVLTTALMERVGTAVQPPDADTLTTLAQERYERDKKKLMTPERRRLSHVLLTKLQGCPCKVKSLPERVEAASKELKSGADFATFARENSQDLGSAKKGGDLGWVIRDGKLVRDFEDAAFQLKDVGDVSEPVITEYGVHLIKLTGLEPSRQLSYDEVQEQLKAKIVSELRFSALQTRRGLAYPDPDTVNVELIGKLVQQRIDELAPTGVFNPTGPIPGRVMETPASAATAAPASEPAPDSAQEPAPTPQP